MDALQFQDAYPFPVSELGYLYHQANPLSTI
jgi:hypothetical protein